MEWWGPSNGLWAPLGWLDWSEAWGLGLVDEGLTLWGREKLGEGLFSENKRVGRVTHPTTRSPSLFRRIKGLSELLS